MVDPDACAVLDCDAVVVDNLADGEVAKNDIGRIHDRDSEARDLCALADANDGLEIGQGKLNWLTVHIVPCCYPDGDASSS